jgi:NADPH-dependent 2,4-dienoyl-CoA reductase/sulfur reductase-like enzyme
LFFRSPIPKAKKLLQDGSTLGAAFVAADKLKGTTKETVKVDTVSITGPSTANVTFDLLGNGKPLLKGSDGQAVWVNGKWLVAKQTFCTLVLLGGSKVKGCS